MESRNPRYVVDYPHPDTNVEEVVSSASVVHSAIPDQDFQQVGPSGYSSTHQTLFDSVHKVVEEQRQRVEQASVASVDSYNISKVAGCEMTTVDQSNDYQLTPLKNVEEVDGQLTEEDLNNASGSNVGVEVELVGDENLLEEGIPGEDDIGNVIFQLRLIEIVKSEPCLYDPRDENFGNKRSAINYRQQVWAQITEELDWRGAPALSVFWKELKDRYLNSLRHNSGLSGEQLDPRVMQAMRFVEEARISMIHHETQPRDKDVYYEQTQNIGQDVMISGYKPVQQRHSRVMDNETVSHAGTGYVVVQPSQQRRVVGQQMVQDDVPPESLAPRYIQQTNPPQSKRYMSVPHSRPPTSSSNAPVTYSQKQHDSHMESGDGNGLVEEVKKDITGTVMQVDFDTDHYNNSGQKMYRLFMMQPGTSSNIQQGHEYQSHAMADDQSNTGPPSKKKIVVGPRPMPPHMSRNFHHQHQVVDHHNEMIASSSAIHRDHLDDSPLMGGGVPIGEDEIIDDGVQESTIVIDADGHLHEESPLLSESPELSQVMISGQTIRQHPHHHQQQPQHIQQHHEHLIRRGSPEEMEPVLHQPQSQYDADLQFQQLISTALSRLNDDDKTLMKYNMQRILLDARFGQGTSNRIMEEEEEEMDVNQVAHDGLVEDDDENQ